MTVTVTTDRALINSTLVNWLETYSGVGAGKVIWLNQALERPAKPYCGIVMLSRGIKTGTDDVVQSYDTATEKVQRITAGPRQLILQIEIYSDPSTDDITPEADAMLENALLALDTEAIRETFRAAKIGLLSHTAINRLDEQLGERWERRAQADIVITYSGETFDDGADSGNWIETVENAELDLGEISGTVYLNTFAADLYIQSNNITQFLSLNQTSRSWRGVAVNSSNNDAYATVDAGDIYKRTNGEGDFLPLSQTSRAWRGIAVNSNNNDVYALATTGGDVYKQTSGEGDFVALNQAAIFAGSDVCINQNNNDVYACIGGGRIYKQTGGKGNFALVDGSPSKTWRGIAVNSENGDVCACVNIEGFYLQVGGKGDFVYIGQPASKQWSGLTFNNKLGRFYACEEGGGVYMQKERGGAFELLFDIGGVAYGLGAE